MTPTNHTFKCNSVMLIDDQTIDNFINERLIRNYFFSENVFVHTNANSALEYFKNIKKMENIAPVLIPDYIFLDINMPLMSGFELIRLIEYKIKIVITTAFREFAAESYELDVLDYLVKPIPLPRFIKCIHKIEADYNLKNNIQRENHRIDPHIFIKVDKKMMKINIDEILFIEGMKEYIKVVTIERTFITHKSLTSLTDELPADRFIRIHKSYTIAIDKVKFIEGNRVQVLTHTLPIGRNFNKEVKSKILE